MTHDTTTDVLARPFTFNGNTVFITPQAHTDLIRLWATGMAELRNPALSFMKQIHTEARILGGRLGIDPADAQCMAYRCEICRTECAPGAGTNALMTLARAYCRETGHELDGGKFCSNSPAYCYDNHTPRAAAAKPIPGFLNPDVQLPDYATAPVVSHGHAPRSGDVHQVRRALAVLASVDAPLAGFSAEEHCITEGAYLDPRRSTGEVVLSLHTVHFDMLVNPHDHAGYPDLAAARGAAVTAWRKAFDADGWDVRAFPETATLERLVLTPPTV